MDFDRKVATHFGQIRAELELTVETIGAYDAMIAGHARSAGLIVVTNNQREFKRVSGFRVKKWVDV